MNTDYSNISDELLEEGYGAGSEISTTGFIVFGLVTFWIYTVVKYHETLKNHWNSRLAYFRERLRQSDAPGNSATIPEKIISNGFGITPRTKRICVSLYVLTVLLFAMEVVAQILLEHNKISTRNFDIFTMVSVAMAALMFCVSSVYFLSWVCRTVKNHEYHEFLLARYVQDPEHFKSMKPSSSFVRRWNRKQNWVAFFLVLSVPMTVSPIVAIKHIYGLIYSAQAFTHVITIWSLVIFTLAAVFHLWGTQILLNMYNDHLRIEAVNQQYLTRANPWLSNGSSSVVDESAHGKVEGGKTDLLPERSLAAIMITDIVGFSHDMERDEEGTYSKLMAHNDLIREVISRHKGQEIKTIGDAFLVRFNSGVDAVRSAMEIQRGLARYNKEQVQEKRVLVRIGIHIGDIMLMDNDVLGNGVNIAARIEPLAEPGGICISADVYNVVKKSIDIKVLNLGRKELKNIEDAPEIFKVLVDTQEEG